ncbi:MAG: hypothetical protein ACYS8W_11940 [Planctomycetota bacterium]|jgi:general secretion pathway protein D
MRKLALLLISAALVATLAIGCSTPEPAKKAKGKTSVAKKTRPARTSGKKPPAGKPAARTGDDRLDSSIFGEVADPEMRKLLNLLELQGKSVEANAENYYQIGKRLYDRFQYRDAVWYFRMAHRIKSDNPEYKKMFYKVLWLVGDRKGEIYDVVRQLTDERRVRITQATIEVERLFIEGYKLYKQQKYDDAIAKFERVLETIKWFPFFIDIKGFEDRTKHWINLAKLASKEQREFERLEKKRIVEEDARARLYQEERFRQYRVNQLLTKAKYRYERKEWQDCKILCNWVIKEDPGNEEAVMLRDQSMKNHHLSRRLRFFNDRIEYWERTLEKIAASSVPYQELFMFPPEEEWEEIHRRTIPLVREVRQERSAEEREIIAKLENQEVTLNFVDTEFTEAINFLRDITGLNFVVSNEALDAVSGSTVNLRLGKIKLKNALNLILEGTDLKYRIKNGVIYIATEDGEPEELYLEFYSVSEIINNVPDFGAPQIALRDYGGTQAAGGGGGGGGAIIDLGDDMDEELTPGVGSEELIELIESRLAAESEDGSIRYTTGLLIVRKPLSVHRKIQKLLDTLQKTVGIMVTVEARFVDIQDNLLDMIGVEWRDLTPTITGGTGGVGYIYQNAQGDNDLRSSIVNGFTNALGAGFPFNVTSAGGVAVQYNRIESYQIQAIFEAVKKTQKAVVVHAPRISIFNTQRSHVLALFQEAYIEDVEISTSGVIPVLNPVIGVLNHGAILEARPVVSHDRKYVLLEVKPTLAIDWTDTLGRTQLVILAGGLTTIPIELPFLTLQKIRSTVICPDGGTVIIGGLKDFREQRKKSGIPVISRIPGVRFFFQRKGYAKLRRSVVCLLTANITIAREAEERIFGASDTGLPDVVGEDDIW